MKDSSGFRAQQAHVDPGVSPQPKTLILLDDVCVGYPSLCSTLVKVDGVKDESISSL
jgi:hypothetical protein